jgi:sugar lactone lactonase YvrE
MQIHPVGSVLGVLFRRLSPASIGGLMLIALSSALAEPVASSYVFTHLAGPLGGSGNADGTGAAARFCGPNGVAVDGAGHLFVADRFNHTIRKITPGGVVSTLAGCAGVSGDADGTGTAARFNYPEGVAVDNVGNVYVADTENDTIRKITPGGMVSTLAGASSYYIRSADGTGAAAHFWHPSGVAVDNAGNVLVADSSNSTVRKVTSGGVVTTLAGTAGVVGSMDGTGAAALFQYPEGVAVDNAGNVYVVDTSNHTIRKITSNGVVTTLAGTAGVSGSADGTGTAAQFSDPLGVAVDSIGNVYVADAYNNHTIRKIAPGGVVTTYAGTAGLSGGADGTGPAARFYYPAGVAVDSAGNLFVADRSNSAIRMIAPGGVVTTVAGREGRPGSADGTGVAARFGYPAGVAVDSAGNLFVADRGAHTIRRITPGGVVTTYAGTAGISGAADGTGAAAQFESPSGVAVDNGGNVYVADTSYSTIRKITPGGVVSTFAGAQFHSGSADGTGAAAQFYYPYGVAVDTAGNVFVADSGNGTIRKITPGGVVTTLAGTANSSDGSTDGIGAAARFRHPMGVAVDTAGNVFVAEGYDGSQGYHDTNTIRKITPNGVVTTLTGTAGVEGSVDGIGTAAQFNSPQGIAVDNMGNLYVADSDNSAIRKGQFVGPPVITLQPQGQTVIPGSNVMLSVTAGSILGPTYQWYFNGTALGGATDSSLSLNSVLAANAGAYTVVVTNALGSVTSNQATLTVSTATPVPAAGSGGGGAIEGWFVLVLLASAATRRWSTRQPTVVPRRVGEDGCLRFWPAWSGAGRLASPANSGSADFDCHIQWRRAGRTSRPSDSFIPGAVPRPHG